MLLSLGLPCQLAKPELESIMRNLMIAVISASLGFGLSAGIAEAKSYKGIWDGNSQWTTTLVISAGNKLKYCFKSECYSTIYSGTENTSIKFNWGTASFVFTWNGQGYNGTRKVGVTTNRAVLK
jgi:hypothetical protein